MDYRWLYRHLKKRLPHRASFIYSHLTGREYWTVPAGNVQVHIAFFTPYHHFIARNLYHKKDEYRYLCKWVEHCKDKSLIYDVGGFTGIYGLAAAIANPSAQVVIFEPHPLSAALIRRNIQLNGLNNCRLEQCAISDFNGQMGFDMNGSSAAHLTPGDELVTVKRLDEFPTPDLMKLDIEGAETAVLSATPLPAHTTLFLELHNWADNKGTVLSALMDSHSLIYTDTQTQGTHDIFTPR